MRGPNDLIKFERLRREKKYEVALNRAYFFRAIRPSFQTRVRERRNCDGKLWLMPAFLQGTMLFSYAVYLGQLLSGRPGKKIKKNRCFNPSP